jgi:protein unc-45
VLTTAKQKASRKLREAATLGHDNADVQAAFLKLHQGQDDSLLLGLCRRYALYSDAQAGIQAVRYLSGNQERLPRSIALECLKLILDSNYATLSSAQDSIIVELARQSSDVRQYFASELQISSTEFFDNLYERGDGAANCLRVVVLEAALWKSEQDRLRVEEDLFQLLLAKLMESGHDLDGRALKGIALLLVADPDRLHPFVDTEGFDAILGCLDTRLPPDVRAQATLASSKYLEVSQDTGRRYFTDFITSRVGKQKNEDLTVAFSAAAGLFPIAPTITAPLFLTDGFLLSIISQLDRKSKSANVEGAFLQLLNAACIDQACRSSISKYCSDWLSHTIRTGTGNQPAVAATVLAKLRSSSSKESPAATKANSGSDDIRHLVHLLKEKIKSTPAASSSPSESIEGLAYASLEAEVKDELAHDGDFLQSFLQLLESNVTKPDVIIGGLSVISNLTQYTPVISEEQRKVAELKAYANASKPMGPNVLNDDEHVMARCNMIIEAGVMPVLIDCSKGRTSPARSLVDKIILSLSRNQKTRGKIAQQGAVKLLILHLQQMSASSAQDTPLIVDPAHALARILISVNPALVFPASGLPNVTSAVQPLISLLKPATSIGLADQPRDLLPTFEGLLALTNLASSSDISPANIIVRSAWDAIEDLLLSNNAMIRRASCELVCNLVATEAGFSKYADQSRRSIQRLHTLLALADMDDLATRRAAGGALAMLTEYDSAIAGVLEVKRGVDILLGLCQDDSEEIVHRGLVCLRNLACATGDVGRRARNLVKQEKGAETLKACLKQWNKPAMLQLGIDALKPLVD